MVRRPFDVFDDEAESLGLPPSVWLNRPESQSTIPPPERNPGGIERNSDADRALAMHSPPTTAQDIAAPGPGFEPPPVIPQLPDTSHIDASIADRVNASFQPPTLEPLPRREFEPGWKGAMKDALRGMIPGYIQGQEAGLKAQQQDVMLRNKAQMDVFKERMDALRPLITKSFEGEAALQKFQTIMSFLDTDPRYRNMPLNEKTAWAWGHKPSDPKMSMDFKMYQMNDGTSLMARWTDKGLVDQAGVLLPPEVVREMKSVGDIPPPQLGMNVIPEGGGPPTPHWFPRPQPGQPAPPAVPVSNVTTYTPPSADQQMADLRRQIMEAQLVEHTRKQETARKDFGGEQGQAINRLQDDLRNDRATRYWTDLHPNVAFLSTLDRKNPVNHHQLVVAMAKIPDPTSVAMLGEQEAVRQSLIPFMSRLKANIERIYKVPGAFDNETIDLMVKSAQDRARPAIAEYHSLRNQAIIQARQITGRGPGELGAYFPDRAKGSDDRKWLPVKPKPGEEPTGEMAWHYFDPSDKKFHRILD